MGEPIETPATVDHDSAGFDIIIGPAMSEGDRGRYPRELAELAEELRAENVTVAFRHDDRHRHWYDNRGPVADAVLEAALALGSGAAIEAVKYVLSRRFVKSGGSREVDLTVTYPSGKGTRMVRLQGAADDVVDALRNLDGDNGGNDERDRGSPG